MLILLAIALMLLCGELTRQFILLHFICIIVIIRFTGFLLSHTLRRQFNAIGCQLAAGWHTRTAVGRAATAGQSPLLPEDVVFPPVAG